MDIAQVLLTFEEAAARLGIGKTLLRAHIANGTIRYISVGAGDKRFHDNRHTAASRLIRRTGNLKAAQKLLGHADISTTARFYAHVDMDDLRELMEGTSQDRRSKMQGNPQGLPRRTKKA